MSENFEAHLADNVLNQYGYQLIDVTHIGRLYSHSQLTSIFLDTTLFDIELEDYPYTDYTSYQNQLMHAHSGLFRFLWVDEASLHTHLELFLHNATEPETLKLFGANRAEQHVDPTPPEFNFAQNFEQVFGPKQLHAIEAESCYFDRSGHRRFIDFVLNRTTGRIAIELNGESYHHPLIIKQKKYLSQLFKQNSLVADGYLVYRWSNRGMADYGKFSDQLRSYFGDSEHFISTPKYSAQRDLSFSLYQHQEEALARIKEERQLGKDTFLVVLPTGTGKTEVFLEDLRQQFEQQQASKALIIVPGRDLKQQTIERISKRIPNIRVGELWLDNKLQVIVQTSAYMLRHFESLSPSYFDYMVVDEAHRAAAHGLRRVLEYFQPQSLLGVTATHERLDQQSLEAIFGSYQVDLTLEQAIENGIVPPIRAFRLQSNIDLSAVRFNGKDFVKSDLHKTVLVPSRDQLIVDLLLKYFNQPLSENADLKQGVIFCVDLKHTQRMAKLLNDHGISAAAVSGSDRAGLQQYQNGDIRFLCACDLINEGWDAPQTSILVMARPTMSKVLYTQQLGRGTRRYAGKEALYVIDVVDCYGAALQPWSLHGLFNLNYYQAFGDVVKSKVETPNTELLSLDLLWEQERRIEPINIFNFEMEFGDLLNEEQLARELFISTGTVSNWLKKGELQADKSLPFGRKTLNYFHPDKIAELRKTKNLKERNEQSRKSDFLEFIEKRDYTFSYKIIFMLCLIKLCNQRGEVNLGELTALYQSFYQHLDAKFNKVEKEGNPLNQADKLADLAYLSRSILQNPFEKYERKRFVYHCKDLNVIGFDPILWEKLGDSSLASITKQYIQDGIDYYKKHSVVLSHDDFQLFATPEQEPTIETRADDATLLPFYPNLKIACGHFKTGTREDEKVISVPDGYGKLVAERHFVAPASGNSMNGGKHPIQDGDLLLLELIDASHAGSISNQIIAIEQDDLSGDQQYLLRTVKKDSNGRYRLVAQNPDYADQEATENMLTFARLKAVLGQA